MSNTTYCDVCGNVGKSQMVWIHDWKGDKHTDYDMCEDCLNKVKKILKGEK